MDYERNKRYFNPDATLLIWGVILILVGVPLIFAAGFGLLFIALGIWLLVKAKRSSVPDAEIDNACSGYVRRNLKSMALAKLGLDEDQVREISPINFDGYCYADFLGGTTLAAKYRVGKDDKYRASNYSANMFFFSADQVFSYELRFSLLDDMKQETTREYFYSDIVSVSTQTGDFSYRSLKQSPLADAIAAGAAAAVSAASGGWWMMLFKMLFGTKQSLAETTKATNFLLHTSSDETCIYATIFGDITSAERSIQGMKNLLRSKKQQS